MSFAGRPTVVIASYLEPDLVALIQDSEPRAEVVFVPELLPTPRYACDHIGTNRALSQTELARWRSIVARAEVMFDFDWDDPTTLPLRCPQLRLIQATSAGIDGFMTRTGLKAAAIEVSTAAGVHAAALSEFVLAGLLHFAKQIEQLERWKAQRHWERHTSGSLLGSRVLVVGLGGIGRQIAVALAGLGVEVWGLARKARTERPAGVKRVISRDELPDALPQLDALVLACALTEQTRGLIGAEEIAALPTRAIVVNVSRGEVVDEPALIDALTDLRIRGACLDVFAHEPLPADSLLWNLDNVILSPHSASTVASENRALTELFIDNLGRYFDGRARRNVYDRSAGY